MEEEKEESELPLPLSEDDSKSQTQNTFVMYENPCYIDDVSAQNCILIYCNPCYCDEVNKASTNDAYEDEFATVTYDKNMPLIYGEYDNALDDGLMLLDDINYNAAESGFDSTILEMDRNYMLVDHENHAVCDGYIVEFVHDATKNYFKRGKYGLRSFHVTRTPLFMLKVLNSRLLYLPMLDTLCSNDLLSYKIPMHRKWVRLKCV